MKLKFKNKHKIFFSITALLSLTLIFNQCVLDTKVNKRPNRGVAEDAESTSFHNPEDYGNESRDDEDPYQEEPMTPPMVPVVDVNQVREVSPSYGIKNFEQVYYTMSSLTGVDPTNRDVERVYQEVNSKLPNDNDIKTFASANQVAIVKLATEFCHVMIDNNTLRSAIYQNFDFGRTPNQVLNNDGKTQLINRTIDHFIGEGMLSAADRTFIQQELMVLTNELLEGSNLGSNVTTRMVGKGLCVTALGSIHSSIY